MPYELQHITWPDGITVIVDLDAIDYITRFHYSCFQITEGIVIHAIPDFELTCKLSVLDHIAAFNLYYRGCRMCTNLACFCPSRQNQTYDYLRDILIQNHLPPFFDQIVKVPFLITVNIEKYSLPMLWMDKVEQAICNAVRLAIK